MPRRTALVLFLSLFLVRYIFKKVLIKVQLKATRSSSLVLGQVGFFVSSFSRFLVDQFRPSAGGAASAPLTPSLS